ncbi:MAG: YceI family protein [Dehalococcoidia bacterium]
MSKGKMKWLIGGAVAAVAVAALAGAALYYTLGSDDAPAQANITSAVSTLNATQSATSGSTQGTTPTEAAATSATADDLAGTWVLAADGESFVGYRVQEELAGFGTFTAVGRTQGVEATMAFDGSTITDVQVTADLTGLTSDNSMRDGQLKRQGLETDTYPTATFVLTEPIELDGVPTDGETVEATAIGDLTLHGVTRSISIPLEGQFTNGYAVIVGSLDITFADYEIPTPSSARVLSIEDRGVMELQMVFEQATTTNG